MILNEFFEIVSLYNWKMYGECIRRHDGLAPKTMRHTPLLVACIHFTGYRGHFPEKFGFYFEQGTLLGLSEQDTHAIFRASDNDVKSMPSWHDLTEKEQKEGCYCSEEDYQFWRLRAERDYNIRQMLLAACGVK